LGVNESCGPDAWNVGNLDAVGNFTASGSWSGGNTGLTGMSNLIVTITDVNGGAGVVDMVVEEWYTSLLDVLTPVKADGVLTGTCTGKNNLGLPAGSSILGVIGFSGGPILNANETGGNCPVGMDGAVPKVPASASGFVLAGYVVILDGYATFTFAAGTPAGATESIPLTESFAAVPEPAAGILSSLGILAIVGRRFLMYQKG